MADNLLISQVRGIAERIKGPAYVEDRATLERAAERLHELQGEISLYREQLDLIGQSCYTLYTHGWSGQHVRGTDASTAA